MKAEFVLGLSLLAALSVSPLQASDGHGHEHHETGNPNTVMVEQAWARATPPGTENGAVYLMIHNHGDEDDRLIGAEMDVSDRVEIHQSTERDGMYRMAELEDGLDIPAGEQVSFEPKSYHIMLLGLHEPLAQGDEHELTLEFEQAGSESVTVQVRGADGADHGNDDHHDHHDHH